jgi:hypothetical protein
LGSGAGGVVAQPARTATIIKKISLARITIAIESGADESSKRIARPEPAVESEPGNTESSEFHADFKAMTTNVNLLLQKCYGISNHAQKSIIITEFF